MFEPIPTPELVHGLGRFRVAALDLPGIQLAAQEHNAANAVLINVSDATEKSYLEVYMRGVNSHLGVTHIAALDLAAINVLGSPNYRREIQGSGTQFSYTRSDGTVVIVDSSGRLVLDIDPRVFCRIISAPRLASLAPGIVAVATKVNDSTKIVKTEVAVRGEFEVFHNLATELQAKVWEFASRNYEGRTIAVTEGVNGVWILRGGALLEIFLVEKSVIGDVSVNTKLYKRLFAIQGSNKVAYFRPDIDTLRIGASVPMGHFPQSALHNSLVRRADLDAVLHLESGLSIFERNMGSLIEDIKATPYMQTFGVSGSIPSIISTLVELQYLNLPKDHQHIMPFLEVGDGPLTGMNAVNSICHRLVGQRERDRMFDHWHLFERLYSALPTSLPDIVFIKVQYE